SRFCRCSFAFCLSRLCLLGLAGREIRSFVTLAIKGNLGDPDSGKRLAMSVNLLVLLFALEVEDQDLIGLAAFHHLPTDDCTGSRTNGAFLARDGQNVIEFNHIAISGGQLLNFHYVAGCDAVLLSSGANYRVHNSLPCPFKALGRKGLILTCKIASAAMLNRQEFPPVANLVILT